MLRFFRRRAGVLSLVALVLTFESFVGAQYFMDGPDPIEGVVLALTVLPVCAFVTVVFAVAFLVRTFASQT